jgi:hypothetical protein
MLLKLHKKNKMVSINNTVEVILVPSRKDSNYEIDDIWYNDSQLEKIKKEAICEIKVFSLIKNISYEQAVRDIYS